MRPPSVDQTLEGQINGHGKGRHSDSYTVSDLLVSNPEHWDLLRLKNIVIMAHGLF